MAPAAASSASSKANASADLASSSPTSPTSPSSRSLKPSRSDSNLAANTFANSSSSSSSSSSYHPESQATAQQAHHGHNQHPVIPAYPYTVSISPYFPGSSSGERVFESHAPDDSNIQTRLPSIAVDYLSHEWKEDDVWASWKAMTKHKAELANGVRLENASWRTWAKQRGKLKTISPETLNWLKDSDVTWLYGPLHTAVDPVPPPRKATAEERLGLTAGQAGVKPLGSSSSSGSSSKGNGGGGRSYSTSSSTVGSGGHHGVPLHVKPILKHRSLSEILSAPGATSPYHEHPSHSGSEDEYIADNRSNSSEEGSTLDEGTPRGDGTQSPSSASSSGVHQSGASDLSHSTSNNTNNNSYPSSTSLKRPGVTRTHSADSAARKPNAHPHGFARNSLDSAGTIIPGPCDPSPYDLPSSTRTSFASSSDHFPPKKRHITFNHRVEQCISVDVDEEKLANSSANKNQRGGGGGRGGAKQPYSNALQRYNSNSQNSSSSSSSASSSDDDDDEDEEDEEEQVLTFRSSSPKSPSFVKPFPNAPDGSGSAGSGLPSQGDGKVAYGTNGPHGQEADEPHTIALLEPTTLKESELMPGPTPIVVFEDGKITAFYGTEKDYVYDAAEHGGMPDWAPRSSADLEGTAIADDEESDSHDDMQTDGDLDAAGPAQAAAASVSANPSTRYADADSASVAGAAGQVHEPQLATAQGTGYFAGPDTALSDNYDPRVTTASQAKYGKHTGDDNSQGVGSLPISANSSASSSEITLTGTSPSNALLYSTSPGSGRGPTKSILKKGRDPSQPGSADYYPPLPPASTRASRAHAQMFDENGDEITSPKQPSIPLPDIATIAQDGSVNVGTSADGNTNASAFSVSPQSASLPSNATASAIASMYGSGEPARGRSISRGNSSSSLYERAQAAAGEYRARSQSGGSSISPVASYSPPFTASLNSLGAGTAVLQNQPMDTPRGRNIQVARPSNRREALSDSSDEENEQHSDDEGQAASMEFDEDSRNGAQSLPKQDTVHFTRQHSSQGGSTTTPSGSLKQSHHASLHDSDEGEVEQVASPDGQYRKLDQSGFDGRPVNAANTGRQQASLAAHRNGGTQQDDAALSLLKQPSSSLSPAPPPQPSQHLPQAQQTNQLNQQPQHHQQQQQLNASAKSRLMRPGQAQKSTPAQAVGTASSSTYRTKGVSEARHGVELSDLDNAEEDERLFDSPYMPSSPRISSSTNLPSLSAADVGHERSQADPYVLSWSDKKDDRKKSSTSSRTLFQSLTSSRSPPAWLGNRQRTRSQSEDRSTLSEDDLSDPANNGYTYGFDDDDDDQKGYVGRATDLIGALWNVGTGLLWGGNDEGSSTSSAKQSPSGTAKPSATKAREGRTLSKGT